MKIQCMAVLLVLKVMLLTTAAHSAEQDGRQAKLTLSEVTCEYAVNPLGVDAAKPRFGWVLDSKKRAQGQSAYRILVASSEEKLHAGNADKWDSGKIDSSRSVNVTYRGKALASGEKCFWKVRVWDKQGQASPWSKTATFEMGLLKATDWQGQWIGLGASKGDSKFTSGKLGQAIHLDRGSRTVRVGHYAKLKPAKEITLSAWIKPDDAFSDAWQEIYRKDDSAARCLLAYGKTGDETGFWFGLGIGGRYTEHCGPMAIAKVKDGQWHLVTATYDGSSKRVYFDGRQIAQIAVEGPIDTAGSTPAYIGSSSGQDEFFPGAIDDLRIHDRALSPEQVSATAKGADSQPGSDHLVGWWKFDGDLTNSAGGKDAVTLGESPATSPLLRKEFTVTKDVRRARIHMSGIGWSELYLNGPKVSDRVLDPGATDYDKRVLYVTHDVTDQLKKGRNVLGVMLGNGWFCEPGRARYGSSPRLMLQMRIDYADGSTDRITSNPTWKSIDGPIRQNDFYNGEVYDARLERSGWTLAGYDDSQWFAANVSPAPGGFMQSQLMPAIKVKQTLKPVKLTNPKPGVYLYDFGQFFGGWARLRMRGGEAGTTVTIKYSGRMLADSGLIDQTCYRRNGTTDYYTLKGDGEEIYEPRFTYHPVRYVQIEGAPNKLTVDDLQGRVTYSDVDLSSRFESSNPMLNRIHQNVHWTLTNGLFGMPLDCLYREHWAWTDPATITGSLYPRKHMPIFWTKWLEDIAHAQQPSGDVPTICPAYNRPHFDPAWGGNYPILVWYLYQYLDDKRMLRQHYDGMRRCVDFHTSIAQDHIIPRGRYGDHMQPGNAPGKEQFISKETPGPLVWTGYYYRGALAVSQAARLLGKTDDAIRYADLAGQIKQAFNRKWLNRDTHQYASGSQTGNLLPLAIDIVPQDQREGVLASVVESIAKKYDGHLHTGNTGTTCMIDTLTAEGHGNLMFRVATVKTYPGWGYMVDQGATTIWEAWGKGSGAGGADSMIMWATIDEFLYNDLAGIRGPEYYGPKTVTPGFRRIEIRPHVLGDLTHAKASIRTVRGRIVSSWKKDDRSLTLDVTVPVNCRARVSVPTIGLKDITITESGKAVWKDGSFVAGVDGITGGAEEAQHVTFKVGSGSYSFKLTGTP